MPEVFFPYQNSKYEIGVNRPLIREGDKQSGATETFLINHTGEEWFAWETRDGPLIYQSME